MNQETNIIEEYFSKLPNVVQKCITSDEWQKRIDEIVVKYSLNSDQAGKLKFEITFVVTGLEPEEDLKENIKNELGVSDLLTEQLANDIEERLLSWIDKIYDSKNKPQESKKADNPQIPEVRPENLPSVEKPTPQTASAPVPNYTPRPKPVVISEPVQTPISVPRFKAVPMNEIESGQDFIPNIKPKPDAGGIMETKLNSITSGLVEQKPQDNAPKKYTIDPYREPLG